MLGASGSRRELRRIHQVAPKGRDTLGLESGAQFGIRESRDRHHPAPPAGLPQAAGGQSDEARAHLASRAEDHDISLEGRHCVDHGGHRLREKLFQQGFVWHEPGIEVCG